MHRVKLLTIALLGILALTTAAFTATSSAALPEMLPEGTATEPIHFKIKQDNTGTLETLAGGSKISCEVLTGEGLIEKLKLGKIELKFEKCKESVGSTACTGLSDTVSGTITTKGTFHSWYALLKSLTTKVNAIAVLPEHTHFSCAGGLVLLLVLGCVAGELLGKLSELLSTVDIHFLKEAGSVGDPELPFVLNDAGVAEKCQLLTSKNEGTEESSAIEQLALLKEFVKLVKGVPKAITALLMY